MSLRGCRHLLCGRAFDLGVPSWLVVFVNVAPASGFMETRDRHPWNTGPIAGDGDPKDGTCKSSRPCPRGSREHPSPTRQLRTVACPIWTPSTCRHEAHALAPRTNCQRKGRCQTFLKGPFRQSRQSFWDSQIQNGSLALGPLQNSEWCLWQFGKCPKRRMGAQNGPFSHGLCRLFFLVSKKT